MNTRERFLNANKASFRTKEVSIGGVVVLIKAPSLAEATELEGLDADNATRVVRLVTLLAVDPETKQPIFTAQDEAALRELPMDVLTPILTAFTELVKEAKDSPKD